jgi:hypothetical protein
LLHSPLEILPPADESTYELLHHTAAVHLSSKSDVCFYDENEIKCSICEIFRCLIFFLESEIDFKSAE